MGFLLTDRSEATWQSHVKCFEFAEIYRNFKTILRDCHGCKHPRNDKPNFFDSL